MNQSTPIYCITISNIVYLDIVMPSSFTGKERDEETGYGYFGARYMDHELMTGWLSVDPMADKYPGISPYAYCAWNPVKLVDPDGRDVYHLDTKTGKLTLEQKNKDKNDVIYAGTSMGIGRNKHFEKNGHSQTISKGVLNGKTLGEDISRKGFSNHGGNQKDGLMAAKFISFESHKELAGVGFASNEGSELDVFSWSRNNSHNSFWNFSSIVSHEGLLQFGFHTHPGTENGQGGDGIPSEYDNSTAHQLRQFFNIHQNYIISRNGGVTQYNEWNIIPNAITILPNSFRGL